MVRAASSLLDQIEHGALDSATPLTDVLRKCVALGGRAGSEQLRDWARRELDGYGMTDDLPAYRIVPATIHIDAANAAYHWQGQQLSPLDIPDFARDTIKQETNLFQGIGELEQLSKSTKPIRLQHPGMPDLVRYMNSQSGMNGRILAMYWLLQPAALHGVVDAVRTTLVSLVAELRAVGVADVPSAEEANQAVRVVVHNAKRSTINVNTNQASGTAGPQDQTIEQPSPPSDRHPVPAWIRGPWGIAVGLSTILALLVGAAAWLGWNPFK